MIKQIGQKLNRTSIYVLLTILLLMLVMPFYLVIVNSTHSSFEIVTKLNLGIGDDLGDN